MIWAIAALVLGFLIFGQLARIAEALEAIVKINTGYTEDTEEVTNGD